LRLDWTNSANLFSRNGKVNPFGFGLLFLLFFISTSLSYSQTYLISDEGTHFTCSGDFYDSGGPSGDYSLGEDYTITFCSSTGGQLVVQFGRFRTRANDVLYIYDGNSTASLLLDQLDRNSDGAGPYTSTGNCLTFRFEQTNTRIRPGWDATISCLASGPCLGLPALTFNPIPNACENDSPFNLTEATPAGGTYSGPGITTSPEFDPSIAGVGIHTITYTYTDINGCMGAITQNLEVESTPSFGYKFVTPITLDAASGTEDLTDFPVLVHVNAAPTSDNLRSVANGGHVENPNGYDIIFRDANYSTLDHQIESYDPTTGEYYAWVRIPVLSSSSTTTIYMSYGNPGISSDPSTTNVWISSYKGVWHLTNNAVDATSTGNNGTESNTSDIAGAIAGGKNFVRASNSYIRFFPLTGMTANDENQTLSVWARYASVPGSVQNFFSIQRLGSAVQIGMRGNAVAWRWGGTILANSGTQPSAGNWHHYVYTFDGTTHTLYIDGVNVGSSTAVPQVLIPTEGNLGRYNNGEYFDGWMDEARYSLSPLSSGWVATEYSNQSNPSGFALFGNERSAPDTVSVGVCVTSFALDDGFPAGGVYSGPGVTGSTFNASVAGVGTHTLSYTYGTGSCITDTKVIIVTPAPSGPVAPDVACCVTNIADLSASGTNLRWYSDPGLTTQVGFGTPFATGQTTVGVYTYYVTQTVNGCESPATTVTLTVSNTTPGGTLSAIPVCPGESTLLSLTGYAGNIIRYEYSTTSSTGPWTNIAHVYDTLTYGPIVSDIWFRALVQAGTCPQEYSSVAAVTVSTPSVAPTSASSDRNNICPSDGNIELSFSGGTLGTGATAEWYSDGGFTTNIGSGNNLTIATPGTSTTYYVRFEGDCNTTTAASVLVTVEDVTAPVPDVDPLADVTAECEVTSLTAPTATDNCGGAVIVSHNATLPINVQGTTVVTWTYDDGNGNTSTQNQNVIIDDITAPVFAAPPVDVTVECFGDVPAMTNLAWTDNCDGAGVVAGVDVSDGLSCPETITRTWSYTDGGGNSASVTQTITVDDTIDPTASNPAPISVECLGDVPVPDITVVTDEADNCTAAPVVAFVSDVSDGNTCPEVITRTYSVTDDCGNQILVTQTITVDDITPPIAVCQDITVQLDGTGNATIVAADVDGGSNDNCGIASMSLDITSFDCSNIGPNAVTLTVEDDCGNQSTSLATVTIEDNVAPIITCPPNRTEDVDVSDNFTIPDYTGLVTASDNCNPTPTLTQSPVVGTVIGGVGFVQTITITADDGNGNISQCTFDITLVDPFTLSITCPADINENVDASCEFTLPDYTGLAMTVGAVSVSQSPVPGTVLSGHLINQTITLTAFDGGGGNVQCTFDVTLLDAIAPTFTAPGDITIYSDAFCTGDASVGNTGDVTDEADNCSVGDATYSDVVDNIDPCNTTITRTWILVDDAGNPAVDQDQIITVLDTISPTASDPADINVECAADVPAPDITVVTDEADNCTAAPVVAFVSDVSDLASCPETITRTYSVTDACGNSINVEQLITINDITPPIAVCQDITVQLDGTGNATIVAADVDGGSSDNCGIASMSLDISSFDCSDIGPNAVTLIVEDACSNQSTCVATVTVEDNLPPSITCQVDVAVTAPAGDCSIPVNDIEPAAISDNCGGSVVTYRLEGATTGSGIDDASGTAFNKGVTTVWYIITDTNNNADSCSFDVTVVTTVVPPDQASSDRAEVCPGDGDIVLSYSGGVMPEGGVARWYDDAGLTSIIGEGNALSIPAPVVTSTYYVRFEGDCDTTAAVSTTVTIKSLTVDPVSAFVDRSEVCAGDGSIILSYAGGDLGSNGVAVWYDDAGFTSSVGTGNNLSLSAPSDTTIYYVRFEADCDTSAAVSVEVDVWPTPAPIFEEKYEIACTNGPLYRYVAGGFAGSTFNWVIVGGTIVDDFNDTIYVDWGDLEVTGSLEVTEISVNGCVSAPVSIAVEVGGPDLDLGDDVGTCDGTPITITPEGTFTSYLWQDGSTAASYTTDQEEWVVLEVTDNNGCATRDSVFVTVWELPVVDLGPDTTLCGEGELLLNAGPDGIVYRWSTGEGGQQILVRMGDPEEIWVEVENEYGCISGDTVIVESCPLDIYFRDIPTAITPGDGNGLNDFWRIDKLAQFSQAVVEIFDRWGTLTWRSEPGYSTPWDGRDLNGREVPMDSYHFVIDLNTGNKKDVVTGLITVIR